MQIKTLIIKDFKGITAPFDAEFSGDINVISGDNNKGKTTILDAIYFLFFGKNSEEETKFSILPLDSENRVIPGTQPYVKALVEIMPGVDVVFERSIVDGATKVKINDFEKTITEYEEYISKKILPIHLLKMMMNPRYFFELTWQKAREEFVSSFKKPTIEEVEKAVPKFKLMPEVKSKLSVASAQEISDNARIAASGILKKKDELEAKISELDEIIEGSSSMPRKEMLARREELSKLVSAYNEKASKYNQYVSQKDTLRGELEHYKKRREEVAEHDHSTHNERLAEVNQEMEYISRELSNLRNEYKELKRKQETSGLCPFCGSELSGEKLSNATKNIKEAIETNISRGKALSKKYGALQAERGNLIIATPSNKSDNQKITAIEELIKDSELKLKAMEENPVVKPEPISDVVDEIRMLSEKLGSSEEKKDMIETREKYIKEQKVLSSKYEDLMKVSENAKEYIHAEAESIVKTVNNSFKNIRIELFYHQKNGIIRPAFIVTLNGVPYPDLNRAGKIIAGLEIRRYFKKFLKVPVPVIIDDFESYPSISIRDYVPVEQVILSVVSEGADLIVNNKTKKE